MALPFTCIYGGLAVGLYALTAAMFALAVRFKYWILHGDGGDSTELSTEIKALAQRRKGAQANYAEYQPYFIFLMFLLELWGWIKPIVFRKYSWITTTLLLVIGSGVVVSSGITTLMSGSSSVQEAAYSRIMDYADAAKKEL